MEVSYEDIKRDYERFSAGFCGHKSHQGGSVRAFPLEYFWREDNATIVCDWCLHDAQACGDSPEIEAYSFEEEETRFFIGGTRLHGQTWFGDNPVPGYTMHPEPPHPFDGGPN